MNTKAIADALRQLADAIEQPGPSGVPSRPVAPALSTYEPSPFEDDLPAMDAPRVATPAPAPPARLPARAPAESAFTKCPAHDREWVDGKFGPYCTAQSEDPNWSNDKGYCRVTPRSAGAWLKQHPKGVVA